MKKFLASLMVGTFLLSSVANAGILILTGDIGQNLKNPKLVGWLTIIFLGGTVVGLVVDENSEIAESNLQLSEGSMELIMEATADVQEKASLTGKDIVTTISPELAAEIIAQEGLSGNKAAEMMATLTTIELK
jgi:hypothetical protein